MSQVGELGNKLYLLPSCRWLGLYSMLGLVVRLAAVEVLTCQIASNCTAPTEVEVAGKCIVFQGLERKVSSPQDNVCFI